MKTKFYRGALGLMVALTLTSMIALAQQRVNSTGSTTRIPTTSTGQSELQEAIQAELERRRALYRDLSDLLDQLYQLTQMPPRQPLKQNYPTAAAYNKAVSRYEVEMAQWQAQVSSIQHKIEQVRKNLKQSEERLVALLSKQEQQEQQEQQFQVQRISRELIQFDPVVDEELADFVLKREAELSGVQTRGGVVTGSRTSVLAPLSGASRTSVSGFRKQTTAVGLKDAIAHVEAVGQGAKPNPELVATAILQSVETYGQNDVMATLFMVFRESIQQTNEDKRYFLQRLQEMNQIAEALGDYLRELNDGLASGQGCGEDSGPQEADLRVLDPDHRMLAEQILKERAWLSGVDGIKRTIRQLQQMESQVRQRHGVVSSQFENANQKSSQYMNMLSSVMKTMNEIQTGVIRNLR